MPSVLTELKLRTHLRDTLDDLPNNLPPYNQSHLLDDLTLLLQSPLYLYAISPRLVFALSLETETEPYAPPTPVSIASYTPEYESYAPPTPVSIRSNFSKSDADTLRLKIARLDIRIRYIDDTWTTQLLYGESVLLEGRQLGTDREDGFEQSFWWFCEEAAFLAYEYRAREGARKAALDGLRMRARGRELELKRAELEEVAARKTVVMRWNVQAVEEDGWKAKPERSLAADKEGRKKLKLKIRFRDTEKGKAGVWKVE